MQVAAVLEAKSLKEMLPSNAINKSPLLQQMQKAKACELNDNARK